MSTGFFVFPLALSKPEPVLYEATEELHRAQVRVPTGTRYGSTEFPSERTDHFRAEGDAPPIPSKRYGARCPIFIKEAQ